MWGDQIKRTTNVQEGSQAVGSRVDPLFDIVNQAGRGGLSRPIATKAMLLGVKGAEALVNVPGTQSFQGLQKIIGEGDRTV